MKLITSLKIYRTFFQQYKMCISNMHYNVYFFTCEFEVSGLLRAGLDDLCLRNHAAFQMSSFRSLYITYTISMT